MPIALSIQFPGFSCSETPGPAMTSLRLLTLRGRSTSHITVGRKRFPEFPWDYHIASAQLLEDSMIKDPLWGGSTSCNLELGGRQQLGKSILFRFLVCHLKLGPMVQRSE